MINQNINHINKRQFEENDINYHLDILKENGHIMIIIIK